MGSASYTAHQQDIVCITDTWLDELMPDSLVHIPGFVCFRRDRPSGL